MSTLVVTNLSLGAGGLPDGSVLTSDIADGAITTAKIANGAVVAADLSGNQTGSAPIYGARAWVNFNGTGTVAIRSSANITSITDNGTGQYTLNFTTAMPSNTYAVVGSCSRTTSVAEPSIFGPRATASFTTTAAPVGTMNNGGTNEDAVFVFAAVFN